MEIDERSTFSPCPAKGLSVCAAEGLWVASTTGPGKTSASDLGNWDILTSPTGERDWVGAVTPVEPADGYIRGDGIQVAALGWGT